MELYKLINILKDKYEFNYWSKGEENRLYFNIYNKVDSYIELTLKNGYVIGFTLKCFYNGGKVDSKKWRSNYLKPVKKKLLGVAQEIHNIISENSISEEKKKKELRKVKFKKIDK